MYGATEAATTVAALGGCLTLLIGWLLWLGRVERRGGDLHAHGDGTVHEHFRGSTPHTHPTFVDRYEAFLSRVLGPAPSPGADPWARPDAALGWPQARDSVSPEADDQQDA